MKKVQKIKARVTWGFSPITRVVKSKKIYNRKKLNSKLFKVSFDA